MRTEGRIRFNILDILIIIVAIALILGVFFRNRIIDLLSDDLGEEITYVLLINQLEVSLLSNLKTNALVIDPDTGQEMGNIISVSYVPSRISETATDGSIMTLEKEGYYDVTLKVGGKGIKSDSGVYLQGVVLIAPGMNRRIITEIASFNAYIVGID